MPSQRDIASGLAKNGSCHGSGVVPAPAESRLAFFDVCAAHVRTNPSFGIVDETLGTLARGYYVLSDGERLDDDYYSLTCNVDGRTVSFIAHSLDPDAVRGMLPRLRHVFEQHHALHRQAVEAIVNV
ncbi:hypothetical protein [Rhodococcus qingshengii]|uniref:hypothetical protein n=1 Tax=Rhodococcus qingshengii TaxID=334542 RepID=UPI0036DBF78E